MVKDNRTGLPHLPRMGQGKRGPEGYFTYLLRQANASVRLALDRALASENMTYPQHSVLTMIRAYDAICAADVARLALLTPQTVDGIVRTLEARGAIRKTRHPAHGRILRLAATEKGRALNKRCRALTHPIESALKAELTPAFEDALREWLVEIAVTIGARGTAHRTRNKHSRGR